MLVESSHRVKVVEFGRKEVIDHRTALRIALGGEDSLWFVEKEHPGGLLQGFLLIDLNVGGVGVHQAKRVFLEAPMDLHPS
jgi:hypothetical protein